MKRLDPYIWNFQVFLIAGLALGMCLMFVATWERERPVLPSLAVVTGVQACLFAVCIWTIASVRHFRQDISSSFPIWRAAVLGLSIPISAFGVPILAISVLPTDSSAPPLLETPPYLLDVVGLTVPHMLLVLAFAAACALGLAVLDSRVGL